MKKSAFALIAFLALAGVTFGSVTLNYVVDTTAPTVTGYTAYKIQATGIGITNLSKFEIVTPIYQAYAVSGFNYVQAEWDVTNANYDPMDYDPTNDSYVMFGDIRLPDLGGVAVLPDNFTPLPINTVEPNDGDTSDGLGSLKNYNTAGTAPAWDAYIKTSAPDTTEATYDLFRLVLPNSVNIAEGGLNISVALYTATDYNSEAKSWTVTEYARGYDEGVTGVEELLWSWEDVQHEVGDCDGDGDIDLTDLGFFSKGWYGPGGTGYVDGSGTTEEAIWDYGNFDGDNDVDLTDLGLFAEGWYGPNGTGGSGALAAFASAVPEPGTVVMLILGALCLLGYRLRK